MVIVIERYFLGAGTLAATWCLHLLGTEHMVLAHGGNETNLLLLLFRHLLFLKADPSKPPAWDKLWDEAPNEWRSTNSEAVTILLPANGHSTHEAATKLNDKDLYSECYEKDYKELAVVEDWSEDVELLLSKLSWVDHVEKLHKYKGREEDGGHLDLLRGLNKFPTEKFCTNCHALHIIFSRVEGVRILIRDSEEITTLEEKDE